MNMIKQYFKQAWHMMGQNKLFSAIYIGGTALAIAATTLFAVTYYVKFAPIYPEYDRARMYTLDRAETRDPSGRGGQAFLGYALVRDMVANLKNAEKSTTFIESWSDENYIKASDGATDVEIALKPTDTQFFDVFQYDFLEGRPFSRQEFESGVNVAVITPEIADKAFGSGKNAVGKEILVDYIKYEVVGVVKGGSSLVQRSYGDVFIPYTSYPGYDNDWMPMLGSYHTTLVSDDPEGLRAEVTEYQRRHNSTSDIQIDMYEQPVSLMLSTADSYVKHKFSWSDFIKDRIIILLVLLLVPALNLSGMISSRMEKRASELGVRKSFGATRRRLLSQVLWENLLMTCAGGLAGLAVVWVVLWTTGTSVLTLIDNSGERVASSTVLPEMLFSPWVFVIAFALCLVLNLASALLPAWLGLRRPIVQSLKEK